MNGTLTCAACGEPIPPAQRPLLSPYRRPLCKVCLPRELRKKVQRRGQTTRRG